MLPISPALPEFPYGYKVTAGRTTQSKDGYKMEAGRPSLNPSFINL
jgi:hypothetical protein